LAIWNILWAFGTFCEIWDIFPHFGILCQEKSGNPGQKCCGVSFNVSKVFSLLSSYSTKHFSEVHPHFPIGLMLLSVYNGYYIFSNYKLQNAKFPNHNFPNLMKMQFLRATYCQTDNLSNFQVPLRQIKKFDKSNKSNST
jgi:hypothetical protein